MCTRQAQVWGSSPTCILIYDVLTDNWLNRTFSKIMFKYIQYQVFM